MASHDSVGLLVLGQPWGSIGWTLFAIGLVTRVAGFVGAALFVVTIVLTVADLAGAAASNTLASIDMLSRLVTNRLRLRVKQPGQCFTAGLQSSFWRWCFVWVHRTGLSGVRINVTLCRYASDSGRLAGGVMDRS